MATSDDTNEDTLRARVFAGLKGGNDFMPSVPVAPKKKFIDPYPSETKKALQMESGNKK